LRARIARSQGPSKTHIRVMGDVPGGALCNLRGPVSAKRSGGAAENSRCLRPKGPSFGNSNPARRGKRPRTGRRFHTASERDIPRYKQDQCLIPHFDGPLCTECEDKQATVLEVAIICSRKASSAKAPMRVFSAPSMFPPCSGSDRPAVLGEPGEDIPPTP
jgi:hypothetical protein